MKRLAQQNVISELPASAGIGLRMPHYETLCGNESHMLDYQPQWVEIHPENYFCGGYHYHYLERAAERYVLSFHAIGLSLGSPEPVNSQHLSKLKTLVDHFNPALVSDHVSWSKSGNAHLNDLLPLPYTTETLQNLVNNIDRVQQALGRKILVENPSTYLTFKESVMEEAEFLVSTAEKSGCGLILDINNIYVQAHNNGLDSRGYIDTIPAEHVGEIHLAGHIEQRLESGGTLLIDSHSKPVKEAVWELYEYALNHVGPTPTLIEWDKDIPDESILLCEAKKADAILSKYRESGHAA